MAPMAKPLHVVSWNVNGLRACARKGFRDWLEATQPDLLGLQEVRANLDQLDADLAQDGAYTKLWNPAERKGYSGVALWGKEAPTSHRKGLGQAEFDAEGRVLVTEQRGFSLYTIYFPNGGDENLRVPFKLAFYEKLMAELAQALAEGQRIVVMGDFNTAHTPIDLARPDANVGTTGFLPEERAVIDRFLGLGFHDVFRERRPGETGLYTWWSQRGMARPRNVGWRIDYALVSANLKDAVVAADIHPEVMGSDHCPVSLHLEV